MCSAYVGGRREDGVLRDILLRLSLPPPPLVGLPGKIGLRVVRLAPGLVMPFSAVFPENICGGLFLVPTTTSPSLLM